MGRLVDLGVVRYSWVTTVANPLAPTVAELEGGVDITCDLTTATEMRADGSNTVSELGVCDRSESNTPTSGKHMGNLVIFRNFADDGAVDPTDLPTAVFKGKYERGFLYRRIGPDFEKAWAVDDVVDVGEFVADKPQLQGGTGAGFVKGTIPLLAQKLYEMNVEVKAA